MHIFTMYEVRRNMHTNAYTQTYKHNCWQEHREPRKLRRGEQQRQALIKYLILVVITVIILKGSEAAI